MKASSVSEIKKELSQLKPVELLEVCMKLARFKKENKELLTYLLFESYNESEFIENLKKEVEEQFLEINKTNYYFIKKSVRKILRNINKHIRYSGKKETEIELRIHYCKMLQKIKPSISQNVVLVNIYQRQIELIKKTISTLHEDLQFDYEQNMEELKLN